MARQDEKVLLVEGTEDLRVIPELVEANGIAWGDKPKDRIVQIKPMDGVENLDKNLINIELKASGLKIFGIIVDADDEPANRWQSVRNCLLEKYPDIPEELPPTGLIHTSPEQDVKLGIWMMPDNKERGMLETFLQFLLPEDDKELWNFTEQSCRQATNYGATYKEAHLDKAKIHTWLAWQNPPGRQLHDAVKQRILSPNSPQAAPFMQWFQKLFEVADSQ
jgi:hypothetical protein